MSGLDDAALDRLLGRLAAPAPSPGLAERIRAEAMRPGREPFVPPAAPARPGGASRRRWARPRWWVGVASVNLALVGAAAASIEVAHHGLVRIAAIPATLFHRVTGTPAPQPHHAMAVVPVATRAVAVAPQPAIQAPAIAAGLGMASPAIAPVRPPVVVARPAAAPRQPALRAPLVAHRPAPVAPRVLERHRPPGAIASPQAERRAAAAERHRPARVERPAHEAHEMREAAPAPLAGRVDEAAAVREANLASRASMPAEPRRPAAAMSGEGGERSRGVQRQPLRSEAMSDRPAAMRGGPWAQWRQRWQQSQQQAHPKKPPAHPNAGVKKGGKRPVFRRRG